MIIDAAHYVNGQRQELPNPWSRLRTRASPGSAFSNPTSAFTTPLDPEDLYELSERMDADMNAAKNIVRESDLIAMQPDKHMAAMADCIADGQHRLAGALDAIAIENSTATVESGAALRAVRGLERCYRQAMSELLTHTDLGEVTGRRELYRRYSRTGLAIEAVAERVWYAVVKST